MNMGTGCRTAHGLGEGNEGNIILSQVAYNGQSLRAGRMESDVDPTPMIKTQRLMGQGLPESTYRDGAGELVLKERRQADKVGLLCGPSCVADDSRFR